MTKIRLSTISVEPLGSRRTIPIFFPAMSQNYMQNAVGNLPQITQTREFYGLVFLKWTPPFSAYPPPPKNATIEFFP